MAIVVPPQRNSWGEAFRQLPDAVGGIMEGIASMRQNYTLPNDLQMIQQAQQDAQTSGQPMNWTALMPQIKTPALRNMVMQAQIKQLTQQPEYVLPVSESGQMGKLQQVPPNTKVFQAKTDPIALENYKQKGRVQLEQMKEQIRAQVELAKDERQRAQLAAMMQRVQMQIEASDRRAGMKPTLLQDGNGNLVPWRPGMPLEGLSKPTTSSMTDQNLQSITEGLKTGKIVPPMLSKRAMDYNKILAYTSKNDIDLAKMTRDWTAQLTWAKSLSSPQMARFDALANSVVNTADRLKETAAQLKLSGMTALNRANLYQAIHLRGNTPQGKLAGQYITDMNVMKEEMANLVMGGYAPTEAAFSLVNRQLQEDYGGELTISNVNEMQRLIRYRMNAFEDLRAQRAGLTPNRMWEGEEKNPTKAGQQQQDIPKTRPAPGGKASFTGKYDDQGNPIYKLPDGSLRPWLSSTPQQQVSADDED